MYYKVFKHQTVIENMNIVSYGIKVYENRILVRKLFDVSTDYSALSKLVDSLNKNKIESIHLDSILEDFYLENV